MDKQYDDLDYSSGREYVDQKHMLSNTIELENSLISQEIINSKDSEGNDIENAWNALEHINRTNVSVKTTPKIENNYDLEQEYLNEYVNEYVNGLDNVTQEDKNQAFDTNIVEYLNSLENTNRPEKNIHNNIVKFKSHSDKHFIKTRNVINNLVTKDGGTKAPNLFDRSSEPVDIRVANVNEQDSCMVTPLRREENNYARKWEFFNTTHEENYATAATYILMESPDIEGVLREDTSVAYLSKILHNLPRYNPIRLRLASSDFDLSIGSNYLPGVLLYGFPIFGLLVLYLMMWNSFYRRRSNKKQIFRRCDMWKVKSYKKMVAFCSFLTIVALIMGVYGAYFTHSDVCATITEKIDPILDVLTPFLFQIDNLLNQLHKALDIATDLQKPNTMNVYPHIKQIINDLDLSVSSYERHITTRRINLTLLKDVESLIMKIKKYERIIFWSESLFWSCIILLAILFKIAMKKYTYFRICLVDILIPGTLLAMIAVTSVTSLLLVIAIGIADFCHNSTQNFINLELLEISNYTMNYYLTGNDPVHAINISDGPYLLDAQKKMHNIHGELPSIDLNSLKQILDELVYNGTQIANSSATKNAFTELTRVLCDVTIEGLLIQACIAGPCAGLFLTLMLLATCQVRMWQKALLCIFLTEREKCFSTRYNCQYQPCKMLLHSKNATGKGSKETISVSDVEYDKKEIETGVGIATITPTTTTPTATSSTAIATPMATATTASEEDSDSYISSPAKNSCYLNLLNHLKRKNIKPVALDNCEK